MIILLNMENPHDDYIDILDNFRKYVIEINIPWYKRDIYIYIDYLEDMIGADKYDDIILFHDFMCMRNGKNYQRQVMLDLYMDGYQTAMIDYTDFTGRLINIDEDESFIDFINYYDKLWNGHRSNKQNNFKDMEKIWNLSSSPKLEKNIKHIDTHEITIFEDYNSSYHDKDKQHSSSSSYEHYTIYSTEIESLENSHSDNFESIL